MALTPASILADYSSGIGTQGATLKVNTNEKRVGIGTTNPQGTLQVGTAITMGSGIITATSFDANTASFSGNVSVGGVLTYEDVTSVDSVGIITARSDVHVGGDLSVTGVSTFTGITTSTTTLFANDFSVSGVSTLGGNVVVGGATTDLVVNGDARVTGILTVGTASLTLDGTTGKITGGSLTDAQVAALSTSIVGTGTTVDVFVYDTSKDSDGGAWRKRTQHTSWYNEAASSTRGSRQEFPSVAVIVAEANQVTIYDGDDPDLPMWMVFNNAGTSLTNVSILGRAVDVNTGVKMLNGVLFVGNDNYFATYIPFISENVTDFIGQFASTIGPLRYNGNIAQRNAGLGKVSITGTPILAAPVNDVAMTVLPNAPIDDATGLSVPTIAVATNGGLSVIRDDGNVFDIIYSSNTTTVSVAFNSSGNLHFVQHDNNVQFVNVPIPTQDYSNGTAATLINSIGGSAYHTGNDISGNTQSAILGDVVNDTLPNATSGPSGLTFISNETPTGYLQGAVAYATTSYNTGWMHGDIKGAFLSGISTVSVTGSDFITNGNFDDTDISYWTAANGATLTHQTNGNPGGNINVASGPSSNGYASRSHTVVVGKYYTLSFDHYHVDGSTGYVNIGTTTGGSEYIYQNLGTSSSWTTYSFTVKATSTNLFTGFYSRPNGNVRYDNISLREADPDRSVNNNGLQVFGTITKSVVATGADLVGYSGFSASNYLQQPYNSDLDFGTGDFSMMYWFNQTTHSDYQDVINRTDAGQNDGSWLVQHQNDGSIRFYIRSSSSYATVLNSGSNLITDTGWTQVVITRAGSSLKMYFNGYQVATGNSSSTITLNTAQLRISTRIATSVYPISAGNSIALTRISASAPSPEQVKKMYEDEKVLFQENAACTLYGSSGAVTALGYDDDEETLYVGTSSGRSDFRGLRRINNTTTAVTTAISASNGLVAEE